MQIFARSPSTQLKCTGIMILVSVSCIQKKTSMIESEADNFKLEYSLLSNVPDATKGYRSQAQISVRPGMGPGWTLEFDYPYEIIEVKFAKILSQDGSGHYVIGEGQDPGTSTTPTWQQQPTHARYQITNQWPGGFQAGFSLPEAKVWTLDFDFDAEISRIWNARILTHKGNHYQLASLPEYASTEIGFIVSKTTSNNSEPQNVVFKTSPGLSLSLANGADTSSKDTRFEIVAIGKDPARSAPSNTIFRGKSKTKIEKTDNKNTRQIGSCIQDNYGIAEQPVPGPASSYPAGPGKLKDLPVLSASASNQELKVFVGKVYDIFPVFKKIYEEDLQLTRSQALAFMFADMSRESATNHPVTKKLVWYIELETAITPPDNSAHAWGPFQAAVTNFKGGGYDSQILNQTGLEIPSMSDFKNPAVSTFAGMKRLAEGIIASAKYFGPNKGATFYLLGTLAHHNTGWVNAAEQGVWKDTYGNEVLRMMQGYLHTDNMTNDTIFWTGQATQEICR